MHKHLGTDIGGYVPASHRAGAGVHYKRIFHVVEKGGETGVGHVNCLRLGKSDLGGTVLAKVK